MGLAESSIFLDSCLAIYLVEENIAFATKLESALATRADSRICISPLTQLECLVVPLREHNQALIDKFENWFRMVDILPMTSEVFRKAAQLRADFTSLKTPDALHLATALHLNCDEFWTNDLRLDSAAPSLVKNVLTG
ncbi:MAG: type II toxin-antitoxin system VapC family toxin [Chloracidobacterium sp.]|nr:type II toxin-antitoxin system VapC family toxin [Chloracidobacterium sp.]